MSVIFGEIRTFPQGDGPDVQLRVFGDEFYARYENKQGYTVVYDPDLERYCYAALLNGHLISSGNSITRKPPKGLHKHLQENKAVRNAKFKQQYEKIYPCVPSVPGIMGTKGPVTGLLPGHRYCKGKVLGLTIIVNFKDVKTGIDNTYVEAMLNADNYNGSRNYCSVREYYLKMSSGKLDYTNIVAGPVNLNYSQKHYINKSFIQEALDIAVNELHVDLEQFDSSGKGVVDAVNFLYAGRSIYKNLLWPHNWTVERALNKCLSYDGISFDRYMTIGIGRKPVDLSIGTFCHETGHILCRFPDLYDYGTSTGDSDPGVGLGAYCLMATGSRLDYGRTPAPVCTYLRDIVGWTEQEILLNQPGQFKILHEDYGTVYKYETNKPNEYFLVENRYRTGLDSQLPSSGLAVFHCDNLGSNQWSQGTPKKHYQCALLQADGSLHLETNRNNGDRFDLFDKTDGVAISYDTIPSTKKWDGTSSELNIIDISEPEETIFFKTGRAGDQGETDISDIPLVFRETRPDVLIPDDDPNGIFSFLTIDKAGNVKDILLTLDISHSFIGDVEATLRTPSGDKIVLHNREWGNTDDLQKTYDIDSVLSVLKDKPIQGEWILCVRDMAAQDTGRLNGWSLFIEYEPADRIIQTEAVSGLKIPDADWKGISSAIPIEQDGRAKAIKVHVEISHTYIGDLQLTLFAPSGQSVILMPFGEGKNKVNLRRTYDSKTHEGLDTMVKSGQEMQGDWILQVIDSEPGNVGTLERWSLALTC